MKHRKFAVFAWIVLAYTILVILWGAYVRATGSGAGCGNHWPLCDGQVIPRAETAEQLIEYSHRISSSFNGLLVIGLLVGAFSLFPKGDRVRKGAMLSFIFILIEGLLGAGLVRLELVAGNDSMLRAVAIALHLVNTFILLAMITLTAWWASAGQPIQWRGQSTAVRWLIISGSLGMLLLGATGAVTALGDTLFPPGTIASEIQADLSLTAHFLIRLRIWHPVIAVILSVYFWQAGRYMADSRPSRQTKRLARTLLILFAVQMTAGLLNILLKVPLYMQMIHLLLADLLWITFVLLGAAALAVETELVSSQATEAPAQAVVSPSTLSR